MSTSNRRRTTSTTSRSSSRFVRARWRPVGHLSPDRRLASGAVCRSQAHRGDVPAPVPQTLADRSLVHRANREGRSLSMSSRSLAIRRRQRSPCVPRCIEVFWREISLLRTRHCSSGCWSSGLPMLAPEVGHLDTRRLPVELGIDQRPVHPVLAVQHELSGGGAHRFQGLRVAVLRGARVDLDQGSGQSCRPVPRIGQSQVQFGRQHKYLLDLSTRGYGCAGEIGQKHAANGSDLKFLRTKFQETFHAFKSSAENITLQNVSGPTSLQHFLTVDAANVPRQHCWKRSDHRRDTGAVCHPQEHPAVPERLHVGQVWWQSRTSSTCVARPLLVCGAEGRRSTTELQMPVHLVVEACFGLAEGLELLSPLAELQFLNVCDIQLEGCVVLRHGRTCSKMR